jgi:hypothetical protein
MHYRVLNDRGQHTRNEQNKTHDETIRLNPSCSGHIGSSIWPEGRNSGVARSHSGVAHSHSGVARSYSGVARSQSEVACSHSGVARPHSGVARPHSHHPYCRSQSRLNPNRSFKQYEAGLVEASDSSRKANVPNTQPIQSVPDTTHVSVQEQDATARTQLTAAKMQFVTVQSELVGNQTKLIQEQEQLTNDREQLTKDQEQLTNDREQLTKDQEQFTNDREQLTKDQEQFTNDREQFTKNQEQFAIFQESLLIHPLKNIDSKTIDVDRTGLVSREFSERRRVTSGGRFHQFQSPFVCFAREPTGFIQRQHPMSYNMTWKRDRSEEKREDMRKDTKLNTEPYTKQSDPRDRVTELECACPSTINTSFIDNGDVLSDVLDTLEEDETD